MREVQGAGMMVVRWHDVKTRPVIGPYLDKWSLVHLLDRLMQVPRIAGTTWYSRSGTYRDVLSLSTVQAPEGRGSRHEKHSGLSIGCLLSTFFRVSTPRPVDEFPLSCELLPT